MHVLLLDDFPPSRLALLQALVDYGMRVVECPNPDRVLDLLHRRCDIRLILMRWNLGGDGVALIKRLRGNPVTSQRRIIMVINDDHRDAITAGLEAGIDDYLVFPFAADDLREKLDLLGVLAA